MIDKTRFAKILATLAALFPRFELQAETTHAYYAILGDLPAEQLEAAALHLGAQNSPWFPSAGQLRAAAFALVEHQEGGITAGEAWQEARRILGDPSRYYPGINAPNEDDFSDPAIYATVQAIGALDIISTPEDALHTTRARFMDTFNVIKQRQRTTRTMLPAVREAVDRIAPPKAQEKPRSLDVVVVREPEPLAQIGELVERWSGKPKSCSPSSDITREELEQAKRELREFRIGRSD